MKKNKKLIITEFFSLVFHYNQFSEGMALVTDCSSGQAHYTKYKCLIKLLKTCVEALLLSEDVFVFQHLCLDKRQSCNNYRTHYNSQINA